MLVREAVNMEETKKAQCEDCNGSGTREIYVSSDSSYSFPGDYEVECCFCDGRGWVEADDEVQS